MPNCQSFAYNFGKGVGALAVAGVGLLARTMDLGEAIGAVSLGCYLLAIVATLLLPETRGLRLSATDGAILPGPMPGVAGSRAGAAALERRTI